MDMGLHWKQLRRQFGIVFGLSGGRQWSMRLG
jgi:hypothetical protein